ncbi:MAG TPA: GAF domain-containing protein [Bacteroidia bacterium]|jgi:L-methionine (R)-S-oxide reductase|nr:GAF domain-containing protein [Bacteroidia bacterium]
MAEDIRVTGATKEEKYISLLPQLKALLDGETDETANLANIAAVLKYTFNFFWVGFYMVKGNELVLGPFQGPVACTRIGMGKGVCGTSWQTGQTIIVDDVDKFPGHIACSSASRSEIVVPVFNKNKKVIGVLDVDDDKYAMFDATDKLYLEQVAGIVTDLREK